MCAMTDPNPSLSTTPPSDMAVLLFAADDTDEGAHLRQVAADAALLHPDISFVPIDPADDLASIQRYGITSTPSMVAVCDGLTVSSRPGLADLDDLNRLAGQLRATHIPRNGRP